MMPASPATRAALAIGAAGALLWLGATANLRQACALGDAVLAPWCGEAAAGAAARPAELRQRIAANPGDSQAYAALSSFPQDAARPGVLRAAAALAPHDPNVLMARAALALEQDRPGDAAGDLVQLVEYYHHLAQQPARALAHMIVQGHGASLEKHLKPGARWFPLVLATMLELKAPLAPALPLMSRAVQDGALPAERAGHFIRSLKAQGSWVDAYTLWLARHGGRLPVLYNAGFDEPFEPDGFDWEITPQLAGREGANAAARALAGRGDVLDVLFTGHSMRTPIVRQYLLLSPGRYRLAGQYMALRLRSESGLAWAVRCGVAGAPQQAGKSTELADTGGVWRPFQFDIIVPAGCDAVASLELETFAPYEATAGIRGRAQFDGLSLQKLPS
jgi:hypothetical protein